MENLGEFIVNHWLLVSLFVVLSWLVFSDTLTRKLSGSKALGVTEAVRLVNQFKGQYVDVREKEEFEKEHIADSLNLPLSTFADELNKLKDKSKPVVLVCVSGQRARSAAKILSSNGFDEVYILTGGLQAWREAKLPLFS